MNFFRNIPTVLLLLLLLSAATATAMETALVANDWTGYCDDIDLTVNKIIGSYWTGVAPIYYDCDVTLFIKQSAGNVVYEGNVDTDTTTWLPGKSSVETTITIPDSLNNGEYTLFVSMKTSDSNAQTINLAMADRDEEGLYKLYSFNVVDEKTVVEATDAESTQITENKDAKKSSNVALIATISGVAVLAILAAVFVILKKKGSKK